ncbi:MAG: alanine--tRNA ligase [Pelodictyon luteolum]|uniref:Alanine--tRNA ligase n=1 Tax=Pelodictyon luteolum TaxID=1100 RepID=A0A165M1K4_PELLU|nr:alanine--tRNA ligase [Pelodictyon luteolum]KZK74704.1 MAG: alanine--tRNA ligase [Pelodictyon luteolum]
MHSREIRQSFLDFFAAKNHTIVRSAPVIPADDPTLLFTNAGMNQFKDVFLAKGTRPYTRAADTQKCIRASGKHNDLEDVGRDTYHHTFFEMLGNWSFGDYYKEEAISWAWELLTEVWKLPAERLYATVYHDDDESARIWAEKTSIDPSHILRFGDKDNFWEMGETGPCGPCSEIHIDLTPDGTGKELVNAGDHRAIELWNLVFIQYDRQPDGRLEPLPQRHVDTGMGFERVCAVMQSKASNYDTDVFLPLFQRLSELTGVTYTASMDGRQDIAMRVIADHARTLTFALSDGAMPSNEGRGYVLRRILRRALRYSRDLGCRGPILHQLVGTLADSMGDVFAELRDRRDAVERIIRAEEESFITTLDRGMEIFAELAAVTSRAGGRMLKGEDAFKLYDTYGFPFDLTRLLASEAGLEVDGEGFEHCMQEQKSRARSDRREKQQTGDGAGSWQWFSDSHATTFLGYDRLEMPSTLIGAAHASGNLLLVLAETPFYAESGGQTGDRGWLESAAYRMQVTDTRKDGDSFVHVVSRAFDKVRDTEIDPMDIVIEEATPVEASVERLLRQETERNHTATHLLHAALRRILGSHVQQKGSFVTAERLRFDFSHFSKMTPEEIQAVEAEVNEHIRCAAHVSKHADLPYDEAIAKGALAFFGDKYADRVRMVEVPGISAELCGGTHVDNIGQIGIFKIISESSAAAGIRRIEALTGRAAETLLWNEYQEIQNVRQQLKLRADEPVAEKLAELQEEKKELEKQLTGIKSASVIDALVRDAASAEEIGGCRIVTKVLEGIEADTLRSSAMALREQFPISAGLLCSVVDGKVSLAAFSSDVAVKEKGIDAGKLIRLVAAAVKGGGGGKAELATAGGKNPEGVAEACRIFVEEVRRIAGAV